MLAPLVRERSDLAPGSPAGWRIGRARGGARVGTPARATASGCTGLGPSRPLRGERAIGVDQTNESVVVGSAVVVKWLAEPALRTADGAPTSRRTSRPSGSPACRARSASLDLDRRHGMQAPLAFFTEWLPGARDGWDWCVQDLLAHVSHVPEGCDGACERSPSRLAWAG